MSLSEERTNLIRSKSILNSTVLPYRDRVFARSVPKFLQKCRSRALDCTYCVANGCSLGGVWILPVYVNVLACCLLSVACKLLPNEVGI